jgi:cell division septation protein DedD
LWRPPPPAPSASADAPAAASDSPGEPAAPGPPAAAAREPASAEADESRFSFYEMLPQFEVVIPEVEAEAGRGVRSRPVEEPGRYVLQAGSFRALADADRRQANIALLGIESRIQRVTIDDDVFHRVRIGPITDLDELNRTRRRLRDAGVETMLMKVPD